MCKNYIFLNGARNISNWTLKRTILYTNERTTYCNELRFRTRGEDF